MYRDPNFTLPEQLMSRFLKSFPSKAIHAFKVDSTTSTLKKSEVVRWVVISSGKRTTLFTTLFLKWLWDELTSQEFRFFLDLPETLRSKEFIACARALASGLPKKVIRARLNRYLTLVGLKPLSRERYNGSKGVKYVLGECVLTVRSAVKYSGWVRHQNDQGSLRKNSVFELEHQEFTADVEIDLFNIISVGKLTILGKEVALSPDESLKDETEPNG